MQYGCFESCQFRPRSVFFLSWRLNKSAVFTLLLNTVTTSAYHSQDFNAETNTSLKLNFVFFLYLRLSASSKGNDLPLCIYFWYQTDSGVPNTSISNINYIDNLVSEDPFEKSSWHVSLIFKCNTVVSNHVNSDHVPSFKIRNISVQWQISIKLFYLYQRLQCRDKYFFKIKFCFLSLFAAVSIIKGKRSAFRLFLVLTSEQIGSVYTITQYCDNVSIS
jgi:hypothetical protein